MDNKILLIATSNMGKVREISEILRDFDLEIKTLKDYCEINPPEETGKTFFENAYLKAKYYTEKTGLMCLADDSGLEVDILNGAPGIYSSRFAGENATDEENNKKLLALLQGIPLEKRKARFVCVIVVYHPSGKYIKTEGTWEGLIGFEPKGSHGFGYDPIFLVPEYNYEKTAAELPIEEKNKLSHRGKALEALKKTFSDFLKSLK
ncbi:MAG: Inosine/xanthosine triphosphate pyrophosphatase [Thermodesulfobacterium sp.]|uniref:dITP/XTP pyrophosphatase n=1 Tax=Candidatus Thermodesulfobacterium syntrophicum TaxID=3060442 RepID=A0AAE3TE98_9BACT|nr:Inosine/xanthosine triphosphate pyrophosphatase [Candidatus Thermodesulfobacterium syntrophicum]